jgi:subtilase family serine protease
VFVLAATNATKVSGGPRTRNLLTSTIDESGLVTLRGNTRPEANAVNDRGAVADDFPMEHMRLLLRRPPGQEQALEQFVDRLHDPESPDFHQWLTAQEFGERYGLAQADLATITGWLQSQGFEVNLVYPNRVGIDFSGTAGQVREAFHTEIHYLEVNGTRHIANISDPKIPAGLAPLIVGVVSLNDFRPHPMYERRRPDYTIGAGNYAVVPADLATIYNLNPLFETGYSGQGQTIVVIEDTDLYSTSDWSTFRSVLGLSRYTSGSFTQVHPHSSGTNNCSDPGVNSDDGEAILDAEWSGAAAPGAAIVLASCANTTTNFGGFIALENLLNASGTPPAIVSISYGQSEPLDGATLNAYINTLYQQAVSEGVSVFVSSGDEGAASSDAGDSYAKYGITVNGLTSTPYNVSVGGTDFSDTYAGTTSTYWSSTNTPNYGSALSYIPEIPWNDSCASVLFATYVSDSGITYGSSGFCNSGSYLNVVGGSGGPSGCATGSATVNGVVSGSCAGYAKPAWQSILGNPSDGVRDIPDVSLFAGNGTWGHYYVVCYSDTANGGTPCTGSPDTWSGYGGTSISSPIMAAFQSLVNQSTGSRWGNPNPIYYSLARTEYGTTGNAACDSTRGNGVASTCIFYDVTQGDMDVPCSGDYDCYLPSGTYGVLSTSNSAYQPAYGTNIGWDFATGIGTVNAYNLVRSLAPSVGLFPRSLTFAPQVVDTTSAAKKLKLTNAGLTTLKITSFSTSGNFAQTNTCGSSLPISASCEISVTFKPLGTGMRLGALSITDSGFGSPQIIPVSGMGTQKGIWRIDEKHGGADR